MIRLLLHLVCLVPIICVLGCARDAPLGPEEVDPSLPAPQFDGRPSPPPPQSAPQRVDAGAAEGPTRRGPSPLFGDVISAKTAPPPLSGGTLHLLADGFTAVATDPDRDAVYIANLGRQKLAHTVRLQPGDEPGRVAEDAVGYVHVVLRRGGAVLSIDPRTGAVLGRRAVCATPRGIAFDRDKTLLYVACAGGEMVSLPPAADGPIARTVDLERDLRDVVVQGSRLFVSKFRSADVLVLDEQGQITERLRPATSTVKGPPPSGPPGASSDAGAARGPLTTSPSVAWRMLPSSSGGVMMVHQRGADAEIGVEPGAYGGGTCGGIVESTIASLRAGQAARPSVAIGGAVLPVDFAISPDGRRLAVVAAGNAKTPGLAQVFTWRTDEIPTEGSGCVTPPPGLPPPKTPSVTPDAGAPDAGADPDHLPDPNELRQPTGETVAVILDGRGNVIVQTREPASLQILTQRGSLPISLSGESRADTGHAVFHSNAGGFVACASCHPEGGEDGRVWTFAKIGPRRTQTMRGGISGTLPLHWSGDMRDLGQIMAEVFVGRMSGPMLGGAHLAALGSWVDAIPMLAGGPPRDPAALARGRALFESGQVGCASCHNGPLLTNNLNVDVGTGGLFQVPSLRGVSWRAPFMHTGCAKTLSDRLSPGCGGDNRHGATSGLGERDRADLVAFLESL